MAATPVECSRVGRWWDDGDEIDVGGLDPESETLLLGECKWTASPVGPDLLADLEALEPAVRWRGSDRTVAYALFSRAGFTDTLSGLADERDDVSLYTPRDLDEAFRFG